MTAISDLNVMFQSISSSVSALYYVMVLLLLYLYIFAVLGVFLFSKNDKVHFGSLGVALRTLFQVMIYRTPPHSLHKRGCIIFCCYPH